MMTGLQSRRESGQALVETALILPVILVLVLNAVNFAFCYLMVLNITAASRSSAIYSVMGGATPSAKALPILGSTAVPLSVSYLAYQDLTGAVSTPSTSNTGVNYCSSKVGVSGTGASTATSCAKYGAGSGFPASAASDQEAPSFLLGRVDVAYQFSPPIPYTAFNLFVLVTPNCASGSGTVTCTFYRHVVMREMQ